MAVILEVKAGPLAGKRIAVVGGQTVTVGRTNKANFDVPHDTFMSGVHFAVEYGQNGCVLTDQKSSNGTFVNGARVTQAPLKGGDEVQSGKTVFVVRMVDEEPFRPAAKPAQLEVKPLPAPAPLPVKPPERTRPLHAPEPPASREAPSIAPTPAPFPIAPAKAAGKPILTIGGWTFFHPP